MRVLLCLLSDQHVPNLLSVHHYKPGQLVLVETPQMQKRDTARHFLDAIGRGGLDYASRCHRQSLPAEDNLPLIRCALKEAHDRFSAAHWIANVTGGTKPMGIATYDFFKAVGGKVVYTNVGQPDRIMDLDTGELETCDHRPTVDEFVTGYGFRLIKPAKDVEEAGQKAAQDLWRKTANMLAMSEAGYDGPTIDDESWEKLRKKGLELSAEELAFPSQDLRQMWFEGAAPRKLSKYEGEFLTGGWLEAFLYNLLSRHQEHLGIWDVALGQNIGTENAQTGASNDIDVSFMHNHGLAMLECKSGSQGYSKSSGMDTLNKIEAVAQQQGALRVRSFFATTWSDVLDKQGNVRDGLKRRAAMYQCTLITRDQIRELAESELAGSLNTAALLKNLFRL